DALAGVERPIEVLKHDLHGAAQRLHSAGRRIDRIDPVEHQRAGARLLDESHKPCERRLATTGFTDYRQRLAGFKRERYSAHGLQMRRWAKPALLDLVTAPQIGGGDKRRHDTDSRLRIDAPPPSAAMRSSRVGSPSG